MMITTQADYPAEGSCLPSYTGVQIALGYPPVSGLPNMVRTSFAYVGASDLPLTHFTYTNMDGANPNTLKLVWQNQGLADAYDFTFTFNSNNSFTYVDTAYIYYKIEGDIDSIKLPSSRLSAFTNLGVGSTTIHYLPSLTTKPRIFNITLDKVVPAGKRVTFWIRAYNGKIYDNGNINTYTVARTIYTHNFIIGIVSVKNKCLDDGIGTPTTNWLIGNQYSVAHFRALPPMEVFKGGTEKEVIIPIGSFQTTNTTSFEVHIKLPDWLHLMGDSIVLTTLENDPPPGYGRKPGALYIKDNGDNDYSVEYTGHFIDFKYLHFYLKADPCGSPVNLQDTVQYYINHIFPNGTLDHVSQVFQPVVHQCLEEGIVLKDFRPVRLTVGLKDTDDNHAPDAGNTLAPANEINHNIYINADSGYVQWTGRVVSGSYQYLYLPVSTPGLTVGATSTYNILLKGGNMIYIYNGITGTLKSTGTLTWTQQTTSNGYFRYNGTLEANDSVIVHVPFKMNYESNIFSSMETEFFVSTQPMTDVTNWTDSYRKGKDRESIKII
jgi:hypothetical protein